MEKQVDYLRHHSPIQIDGLRKGHHSLAAPDRFTVLLPCFLDTVKWEVIYNLRNPTWPPDVVFGADDPQFQPLITSESVRRMYETWSLEDPSFLVQLLLELRSQYLEYQKKRVEGIEDPRLHFEFNTINEKEGLETGIIFENDSPQVIFCIPLSEAGLSGLAEECCVNISTPQILFQVKFPVNQPDSLSASSKAPEMRLHAPYLLRQAFNVEDVKLPPWAHDMCLVTYIPALEEILASQIEEARSSLAARRSFIEALCPVFDRPLEAETKFCRHVSLIASASSITFVLHISLSLHFPKAQPVLTVQCAQHLDSQGRVSSRVYDHYPWSPRWDADEMVSRISDFIADEVTGWRKTWSDMKPAT